MGVWYDASMEPRLLSRGYGRNMDAKSKHSSGFNGATTSQPWIPKFRFRYSITTAGLQWSHDFSAVDTSHSGLAGCRRSTGFNGATTSQPWIRGLTHALAHHLHVASMEPRLLSRGYVSDSIGNLLMAVSLQWSHDFSAVDTTRLDCTFDSSPELQWSHDFSAVDTWPGWDPPPGPNLLQWSHDFSAVDTASMWTG